MKVGILSEDYFILAAILKTLTKSVASDYKSWGKKGAIFILHVIDILMTISGRRLTE